MLFRLTPALLLISCALSAVSAEGLSQLVTYTSSLDDSAQQYGVYLPKSPAPSPAGYPAVLHAHGYGWSVGTGFSDFQKQWAERHGWILINLNARGPQFYEGVGDVETRNVIRDANRRFGVDTTRVFITGGSMGGTGAFRHGIRYPDLIAAAVGVDGWSDYREWHYHWYARTDQAKDIEEFRRPLLEACSPLYWTGRARWGQVQASVSGLDSVVLPENGLLLYNALLERANNMPGAYDSQLYLDYDKGHGGSFRIDQIYEYFLNRSVTPNPGSFLCESTVLVHGNLYWGSMERLKTQGAFASLESGASGSLVSAVTRNLSEFALHLQASPASEREQVTVYVDGFPAYEGPPQTVHFQADWSPTGQVWGWRVHEPEGLRKTPALEGPLGEAFKVPFVVVYGTAGTAAETARNRREATDFARGWNGFMVHAEAVQAIAEERLSPADLAGKSLVVYGTENSSRLLQRANARHELPVRVRAEGITVRDPLWGDREYLGPQFGAFTCYPNPLSDFSTYLVVCRGQFATKADGSARQGLEYDLEKLPWAYSDYVIFNTDQSQIPFVLNVNNKPPVTCYEAGYFVEAGYHDQDWRPYRMATLDRLNATKLSVRRISVGSVTATAQGVTVRIADTAGAPVNQARVTVRFADEPPLVVSGVTGESGEVFFAHPTPAGMAPAQCAVVNVMATGAEYDFTADAVLGTEGRGVSLTAAGAAVDENGRAVIAATVGSTTPTMLSVSLKMPAGEVSPPVQTFRLEGGQTRRVTFQWEAKGCPPGTYSGQVQVRSTKPRVALARPVLVGVARYSDSPLRLTELKTTDVAAGSAYLVTARLLNTGGSPVTATVHSALLEAQRVLAPQAVTLKPQEEISLTFAPREGEASLLPGVHTMRLSVAGHFGVTAAADFTVK